MLRIIFLRLIFLRIIFLRIIRRPAGAIGLGIICFFAIVAILAPQLAPYTPFAQHAGHELSPPSTPFLLGTDELGRDVLSRILYGARISLGVGLVAVAIGSCIGISAGLLAGVNGGIIDAAIMRVMDTLLAFPGILLGIAVATVLGPGLLNAAVAVGIVNIPQFGRISRASFLIEREKEYVLAAQAGGVSPSRIVMRHVLPNIAAPLFVQAGVAMAFAVLLEAGLSFLGLGVRPPAPSWGTMLETSRSYLQSAPWYGFFPGLALTLLILGLNFTADALRDAVDPRTR